MEGTLSTSASGVGGLNQRGGDARSQKQRAAGYTGKAGLLGFAHRLTEGCRRVSRDSTSFQLSN